MVTDGSDTNPERAPGYVSEHLERVREGLGYTRSAYATKAWTTYGQQLPENRSAPLLEIGPGGCELVELLTREQGYTNVAVVDREPEAIEHARALGVAATLSDDLVDHLETAPERYEAVLMLHVLEHIPKVSTIRVLEAVRTALRPDGSLFIEVPNMGDPFNGVYARYGDFTHEVGFTEESLEYVLRRAGFGTVTFLDPIGATGGLSVSSSARHEVRCTQRCGL